MTDRNPLVDFGGTGPVLHFAHANGYPPGCYRAFLEPLAGRHHVLASSMRPLWQPAPDPASLRGWSDFADDLIASLEADACVQEQGVIGVGHSLGAFVTLIAAVRRPDLFRALVLIEPPFLLRRHRMALYVFRHVAPRRFPLVGRTLRRREHWGSVDEAFRYFRNKPVFRRISDEVLEDYARYGTRLAPAPADDPGAHQGRALAFSKQWEARIYLTLANHQPWLRRCRVPAVAVRGGDSDTLLPGVWEQWKRTAPSQRFLELPGTGHLLPFEEPALAARRIMDALDDLSFTPRPDGSPSR
ncbi:MAG: alpha/beta hydrolase [Pseudohongiellaceae bacterium]